MPKRVLMIVGDYVEDYEVMVPFQMLQLLGHEPHAVCPDKVSGDTVATAIHDFEGDQTFTEKPGHRFRLNGDFSAASETHFDALLIPGGRSPEYLRVDPRVIELVQGFARAGKPIAATCHAAQLLAAADVIRGRRMQAYPACRPDVELAGGLWDEPSPELDSACVDGNLVTAPAWPANAAWVKAFARVLDAC
ncbi:Putative cysteine protease YraA [Pirellulimonas nuda]|uniref:Cysteine protease YraA n=1 Tax=Pirellulimonas nuda TaxID=2528009 RepID=A0A518DHC3_9BACT|nr:DJ-1/PfpI family protein [Pirellulimonas nuda]QDU90878.1 Putative cysteine protease YraA [Pirellulimonas nuda]